VHGLGGDVGRVTVAYIYTSGDMIVRLEYQESMVDMMTAEGWEVQTLELETGQCPNVTKSGGGGGFHGRGCGWLEQIGTGMRIIGRLLHREWTCAAAILYPVLACAHALETASRAAVLMSFGCLMGRGARACATTLSEGNQLGNDTRT